MTITRLLIIVGALATLTAGTSADPIARLAEGSEGRFCIRHDAPLKLFKRGGFTFCANVPALPTEIEAAIVGEPRAALLAAIKRFGVTLHRVAGVQIAQGMHPGVIFVVGAQPAAAPEHDRPPSFAQRIAGTGIVVSPLLLERIGNQGGVGFLKSKSNFIVEDRPELTIQTIFADESSEELADDVRGAFVTLLGITATMTRPEAAVKVDNTVVYRDYGVKSWLAETDQNMSPSTQERERKTGSNRR